MYDVRVDGSSIVVDEYPTWDLHVEDGIAPLIDGLNEEQQRANISVFLQKGSVPSLESTGVDWAGFFVKSLSFGDIDTAIREALIESGSDDFEPSYDIVNDSFYTVVKRIQT